LDILSCDEECVCWICLAFFSTHSLNNKTFWVTLSYSVGSFILLFAVCKL
jgi:hypothetical protein